MRPTSSSEKTEKMKKITSLFADELRIHLFSFGLFYIILFIFLMVKGDAISMSRDIFALLVLLFFFFFAVLEHVFKLVVESAASSVFSVLPAVVLFFLLKELELWQGAEMAVICASILRLVLVFMPRRKEVILYGVIILDIISLCLYFIQGLFKDGFFSDKLLFVSLVVLTFSSVQCLFFEKRKSHYPFYYFGIMAVLILVIPMKSEPIDWTKVASAGQRIVDSFITLADNASYMLSSTFGSGSNYTGYNSFGVNGGKITGTSKQQLILRTSDKPYVNYIDEETNTRMKMRRTLYLEGGKGSDITNILSFVSLLYASDVDKEYAALFSRISKVDIEYVYLDTYDEIAPAGSYKLINDGKILKTGVSSHHHKKGYLLNSTFLDIDYGSPYLINLMRDAGSRKAPDLSYDEACDYIEKLYGIYLQDIISREDYDALNQEKDSSFNQYTDVAGASDELISLTETVTAGADSEYDKCKVIEGYLRQYTYNTSVEGTDSSLTMDTAEGLSGISEEFLFKTRQGYCVQFTSAMVMMLRLSGIPARAAFGYRYVYPFEQQESYDVDGKCAHTWPEAYIENVGWVPFEPTSAFLTSDDYSWHARAKEDVASKNDVAVAIIPEIPEFVIDEEPVAEETDNTFKVMYLAIIVMASIIVLIGVLIGGSALYGYCKYQGSGNASRVVMDVGLIKKALVKGYSGDFTDRGLIFDYLKIAPDDYKDELEDAFDIYYRIIYGGAGDQDISPYECENVRELRKTVKRKMKMIK